MYLHLMLPAKGKVDFQRAKRALPAENRVFDSARGGHFGTAISGSSLRAPYKACQRTPLTVP
jgi:hypothetical protein